MLATSVAELKLNREIGGPMQVHDLVIVLGSTIIGDGVLSKIASERLDAALDLIPKLNSPKLILTGGFGDHFNKTARAYSLYAQDYLIKNGLSPDLVAALVPSLDTVEDATLSFGIVNFLKPARIFVLTSDFHLERVRYIFGRVYSGKSVNFVAVPHIAEKRSIAELLEKEKFELATLMSTGKSSLGSPLVRS